MDEKQPTPAHLFGELVITRCLQVVGLHAERAAGDTQKWPNDQLPVFYAKKLLEEAELIGMDTVPVWEKFVQALQKERPA